MFRGLLALTVTWSLVFAVTLWSSAKKVTPEKVTQILEAEDFADWSGRRSSEFDPKEQEERRKYLDRLIEVVEEVDLREIGQVFTDENYLILRNRLSMEEAVYVADRLYERFKRYIVMFDRLGPDMREDLMRRGMRSKSGDKDKNFERLNEEHPGIVDEIVEKGGQAVFEKASSEKKFALVSFFISIQESLQGFGKPDFGGL